MNIFKVRLVSVFFQRNATCPRIQVGRWIQNFRFERRKSSKRRRVKRSFSVEFKVDVINYYQTHDETLAKYPQKLTSILVKSSLWRTAFNQYGIESLKPHPKGRKTKVKHKKKKLRKLVNKNEIDQLREELTKKNQELYDAKLENENLKKINDPVRNLKGRKKTQIVDQIRVEEESLLKSNRYKVGDILKTIGLKKATYHDERKRIKNYVDKYEDVKVEILKIAERGRYRGRLTYGYRRVQEELIKLDIHLSDAVVRRLMDELNVQRSLYNRHRNGRYPSYKGTVGKVARNVLHQHFNETVPFKVLHTDVTQVRLADTKWAYVSAITDEASKEVLAFQ